MSARVRSVKPDVGICLGQVFPGIKGCSLRNTLLPKLIFGELRVKDARRFIEEGA